MTKPILFILALLGLLVSTTSASARSIRDDLVMDLEPGGLVLLVINGSAVDVGLSGGRVVLERADSQCTPTLNTPCAYVVKAARLGIGTFSFQGHAVTDGRLVLPGPLDTTDDGGGVFIPAATPVDFAFTIDGGRDGSHGESPNGITVQFDLAQQMMVLSGSFSGDLRGNSVDATIVASGISPFRNVPPTVNAGADRSVVDCGQEIPLSAVVTDATPGDTILSTQWLENGVAVAGGASSTVRLGAGAHALVAEAFDSFGARGTDTMTLTVARDVTPPLFRSVPPDIVTTSCGAIALGVAQAEDAGCGVAMITNNRPAKFVPGTTVVTWTATDQDGNVATATQRVTLVLGDDPACCPAGSHVILGTSNNDTLTGTAGSDCILGRGAQDTINGLGGDDFISGGDGDDIIDSGTGNDRVFGGSGQDRLTGNSGDDQLNGGDGDDICRGGIGNDILHGGQGQDQLFGEDGNDQLFGDDGDDRLDGGTGNDTLVGGGLHDTCTDSSGINTFATCQAPAPNSCVDLSKDGTETDVDCGGGCSTKCQNGKACIGGGDCQSNLCSANLCR